MTAAPIAESMDDGHDKEVVMSQRSRASCYYQERTGQTRTVRGPSPALAPGLNPIHTLPVLRPPLPLPEVLLATTAGSTPDQGSFTIWPHGVDGESPR